VLQAAFFDSLPELMILRPQCAGYFMSARETRIRTVERRHSVAEVVFPVSGQKTVRSSC